MSSVSLKLDNVHISYPPGKLRLFVKSSASLNACARPEPLSASCLLDLLLRDKVWASRGPRCCMVFRILFNNLPLPQCGRNWFVEEIGRHVCDLPLWSQLPLLPSLRLADATELSSFGEDFGLDLASSLPLVQCSPLNPDSPLYSHEVLPPSVIEKIHLQRIEVRLDFYTISHKANSAITSDVMLLDERWSHERTIEKIGSEPNENMTMVFQECLFHDHKDLLFQEAENSQSSLLLLPTISKHEDVSSDGKRPVTNPCFSGFPDIGSSLRLVDVAIRTLIGGTQSVKVGVRYLNIPSATGPLLSEIFPSMWSPTYSQVVSQRSNLISTISQSMRNSILHNAQSPNLQQKILRLIQSRDAVPILKQFSRTEARADATCNIESSLWRLVQSSLRQPDYSRRLRPGTPDLNVRVDSGVANSQFKVSDLLFKNEDKDRGILDHNYESSNANQEEDIDVFHDLLEDSEKQDHDGNSFQDLFEENLGCSGESNVLYSNITRVIMEEFKGNDPNSVELETILNFKDREDLEMLDVNSEELFAVWQYREA